MFFGWVRTFVAHFLGKRNLEVYTVQLASAGLNRRPMIRVITVNGGLYSMPTWETFKEVIRNALADTPENEITKIIERLRDLLIKNREGLRSVILLRKIMEHHFSTYFLPMHCEAVVAAILTLKSDLVQPTTSRTVSSTDQESKNYSFLAELNQVLVLMHDCETFHSCLPRTWPTIWFRLQNYAVLFVGNFIKFSGWKPHFVAVIPL